MEPHKNKEIKSQSRFLVLNIIDLGQNNWETEEQKNIYVNLNNSNISPLNSVNFTDDCLKTTSNDSIYNLHSLDYFNSNQNSNIDELVNYLQSDIEFYNCFSLTIEESVNLY